tara:strand:- start:156 stop:1601 length:1446 start_codon:yes stop_codon:yes gene_type:complete
MSAVRIPSLVLFLLLFLGVLIFSTDQSPQEIGTGFPRAISEISIDGASGDVWFCLGPTAESEEIDDRILILTNDTDTDIEGRVTVSDDIGRDVERNFLVAAKSQLEIRPGQSVPGAVWAGVTVEVPKGKLFVEDQISGLGVDIGPCATSTSSQWQIPWATTSRPGSKAYLLLYNPFQAPAVADLRFIGDIGRRETLDSQGVVVAGRSIAVFDLTNRIADSTVVSASVDARVGQLIVSRFQSIDGNAPVPLKGIDLNYGSHRIGSRLFFPGVSVSPGDALSVVVVNPGENYVEAEVVIRPMNPVGFVEPHRLVLRSRQRQIVDFSPDLFERIGPYGLEVHSLDGQSLAASLIYSADFGDDESIAYLGFTTRSAVDIGATTWHLRFNNDPEAERILEVMNLSSETITNVEFFDVSGELIPGLPRILEIQSMGRFFLAIPNVLDSTVVVKASAPVIASFYRVGSDGRFAVDGVSVSGTSTYPSS